MGMYDRPQVVLQPNKDPKRLGPVDAVGVGPNSILLTSDGDRCRSGAVIYVPFTGNISTISKVVRLDWIELPVIIPPPSPPSVSPPPSPPIPTGKPNMRPPRVRAAHTRPKL